MARIQAIRDEDIDYSDIPPVDERAFWEHAILWPGSGEQEQIVLDPDVAAFFRSRNQGEGIQTTVNNVLRQYVETQKSVPISPQGQRHKMVPR